MAARYCLVAFLLAALPARAAVFVQYNAQTMTVTISGAPIVVTCVGGVMTVPEPDVTNDTVPCNGPASFAIIATGGADVIDLSGMRPSAGFRATATTSIQAGEGSDSITGSYYPDSITAGGGDDVIRLGDFSFQDTVSGGSGDSDVLVVVGQAAGEPFEVVPAPTLELRAFGFAFAKPTGIESIEFDTGGGDDSVTTWLLPTISQSFDGGEPSTAPGDTIFVWNNTGNDAVSPVVGAGFARIVHRNLEMGLGENIEAFPSGEQEVPRTNSIARSYGAVTLAADASAIYVALEFAGLASNNTVSHIHGPALRGASAAPLIDLPASGATSGAFSIGPIAITPTQLADLRAGRWYINVHSSAFPNGEIRGQLDNATFKDGFE